MRKISKISSQKRKGSFNIYLDGEYAFSVDSTTLVKYSLKTGKYLTADEIDKILKESELQKVIDKVLRFLAFRPRSSWEIADYLRRKKTSSFILEKVLSSLEKKGQINDFEFAKWWVQQRNAFRPMGKIRIIKELKNKRIAQDIIEQAINDTALDEFALAQNVIRKKLNKVRHTNEDVKKKFFDLLLRRGFSYETCKRVIDNLDKKE